MEKDAEGYRTKFNNFINTFEFKDSKGKCQNAIYDALNNENYSEDQKSQLITDMYIQATTPKPEEKQPKTSTENGKG